MIHNIGWWVVAPTGEALFVNSNKKYSKNAAHYNLPKKRASLSSQLCQRVGLTRTNFDWIEIEQPFCGWPVGQNTGKYFVIPLADLTSRPWQIAATKVEI